MSSSLGRCPRPPDRHRPLRAARVLALMGCLLATGAVPVNGGPAARASEMHPTMLITCGPDSSVSVSPTRGPIPLTVRFAVESSYGTASQLNWSFGDGTFLNGSFPSDGSPVHVFRTVGTFGVAVRIGEPSGPENCFLNVDAFPAQLMVSESIRLLSPVPPWTVHAVANASGGSGTFVQFLWSFGDGSMGIGSELNYTYSEPGTYVVAVNVTDSAGAQAAATRNVTIPALQSSSATDPPAAFLTAPAVWGAAAAAAAVALVGIILWRARQTRTIGHLPPDRPAQPDPAEDFAGTPGTGDASLPVSPPSPRGVPSASRATPLPGPPASSVTDLQLSSRVLLHLSGQPRLGPYEPAIPGRTQARMAAQFGVRQGNLSTVLRRLEYAQLVAAELRHVRGAERRLKVYRLTAQGEAVAADLRRRPPPTRETS